MGAVGDDVERGRAGGEEEKKYEKEDMHGEETLMQFKKGGKEKGMFTKKKCQEPFSGSRAPENSEACGRASSETTCGVTQVPSYLEGG
ncbi:MAG: hypothetical protein EXR96_07685 [Nitrospiraceae bacterium]|nr:hypothetical protein [Nitrospiraceae bacterium]